MDRIRRLAKSKASTDKTEGSQWVHKENHNTKTGSQSLVARLMGLDGLPIQNPVHRQQESFGDYNILNTASVPLQGDAELLNSQSNKKRSPEQPEFKDVFEDTVKKSSSNQDVIRDLLDQPDPLFAKHLHSVQGSSSRSLCNHLAGLKLPKEKTEAKEIKLERNTSNDRNIGSKQRHKEDIVNHSFNHTSCLNSSQPSNNGVEGKEGCNNGTARIVILKPNYAMAHGARNSFPSVDSSRANISGSRKHEYMTDWTKEEGYVGTIDFSNDVEISPTKYREARAIAKKVTRRITDTTLAMKEREAREIAKKFNREVLEIFGRMRMDFPSCVKEIPGTGGLYDFSGIDSASESEVTKMTSYDSAESFVSRQAKKRLLERWKRAHRSENAGDGGNRRTLGEMLSISDEKFRNLHSVMFVNRDGDDSDRKNGNARWVSPLGISSRDGWMDKSSKSSSRSRSLPPPSVTRNDKLNAEREYRLDDKLLVPIEVRHRYQNKEGNGNFDEKDDLSSECSRFSKRRSHSRPHRYASESYTLLERHLNHHKMETDFAELVFSEEQPVVPPTPAVSPASSDELPSYISRNMLKQCDPSAGRQYDPNPKSTGVEAESSGSSKAAEYSSPIRVLQLSNPECFEEVGADLNKLRKQLDLLRNESVTYVEGPMRTKIDIGEGSRLGVDDEGLTEWESSYISDVLKESGFYDADTCMLMARWSSPNFLLGPWVFDNLEKKYCDKIAGLKYERKLLFDRIYEALSEISQSLMNPYPLMKPGRAQFGLKWQKAEVRDEVHKLLAIQEKEAQEDISVKLFDKETQWLDSDNSLDIIGKEIEELLIHDLVTEVIALIV